MTPRTKKLLGALFGFPILCAYIGLAAWAGTLLPNAVWIRAPFYAFVGIAWAFPLKPVLIWMNSPASAARG